MAIIRILDVYIAMHMQGCRQGVPPKCLSNEYHIHCFTAQTNVLGALEFQHLNDM